MGLKDQHVDRVATVRFVYNTAHFHFQGQFTGPVTGLGTWKNTRGDIRILGCQAVCRSKGGTITAFTIDVQDDGTSLLTAVMDLDAVSAGVVVAGVLTAADLEVALDSLLTINLNLTGSSDVADDIDVAIDYRYEIGPSAV